jgi:Spx/MgsR family transcriptional regulator
MASSVHMNALASTPTIVQTMALYGIPNCGTVKKARAWLDERGVAYRFHDFKKAGVPGDHLQRWMQAVGWEKVLNRQGMTWRKTAPAEQAAVTDSASAAAYLTAQPGAIKRPVVEWLDGRVTVGFSQQEWERRV